MTTADGHELSLPGLVETLKVIRSDRYKEIVKNSESRLKEGREILHEAYRQGIITKKEFQGMGIFISASGALIVIPNMKERQIKI